MRHQRVLELSFARFRGPLVQQELANARGSILLKVSFEFESARAKSIKTLATIDTELREQKQRDAVAQAKKHRGITDAVEVLGARIKDLKLGPMTS